MGDQTKKDCAACCSGRVAWRERKTDWSVKGGTGHIDSLCQVGGVIAQIFSVLCQNTKSLHFLSRNAGSPDELTMSTWVVRLSQGLRLSEHINGRPVVRAIPSRTDLKITLDQNHKQLKFWKPQSSTEA